MSEIPVPSWISSFHAWDQIFITNTLKPSFKTPCYDTPYKIHHSFVKSSDSARECRGV